ncbi:hypothetical protein Tco_0205587 [Tanacetum coccineum]
MEISIADQIALDDALVALVNRLKIGKCNLRLSSDVTSKEASAYIHNRSVRFKKNNKKHILNLDQFRDILQICPKVGNKKFEEPPLEKEILAFLANLGHSGEIKKITDVNGMYNNKKVDYAYLLWEDFIYQIENKNMKKGNAMYYPRFTKLVVNFVMDKDPSIPRRNKLYGTILPVALTNEDIRNSESYKEYYAIASGKIPPKTKGSKKKADTDATTKQKPPTVPKEKKEKKSGKGKQKAKELETISEAVLTEAEQLKIITKRSHKETHVSHASRSSEDDQADDKNDDDENAQDDEDSDNEVEGVDAEGEKSDEDATYVEDQGNEADKDTNANLEGRDDVMTDVILPQVQATQEIEDTHVTLTPVNPDGQQQSSSVSSGFVSNMLNPNQDTGVDAIFGQHAEATSLIDIPVTAIAEPSFFAPTNRPPTPNPLFIQLQQPPILTPATTPSSSLQNLPDFGSLFGFDYRLKALEDNFSELKQTNQYAEALSSIPGIVDQYLANKMQEAVDVAVQLKYDRIREEAHAENQQFLDSIDEGMKKVIKEQVKNEVSKITPKIEKLVNEQLESEVLVRSSKEAKTSHAVAANLSELELKKILIDKMEANNSINRSDVQRQLYKALVECVKNCRMAKLQASDWNFPVGGMTTFLYKFQRKRLLIGLRIQDIEYMLLLLVQGKVTNLNVEERIAFNLSKETQPHNALDSTDPIEKKDATHHTPILEDSSIKTHSLRPFSVLALNDAQGNQNWSICLSLFGRQVNKVIGMIKKEKKWESGIMSTEMELTLEQTQQGVSYEVSYDESNTSVLEKFNTTAGNPVKKILLKLNLSDHRIFKMEVEVHIPAVSQDL